MKDNTRKTLLFYWRQAWRYHWAFLLLLTTVAAVSFLNVFIPLFFKDFFNLVASTGDKSQLAAQAIRLLIIIAILNLLQWALWRINNFVLNRFESRSIADLANDCFQYLHRHSFSYFNNNFVGSLVKRVNWFTRGFEGVMDKVVFNIIPLLVNVGMIVFILARINTFLGIGILIWAVFFLGVNYVFTKFKLRYDIARNVAESATTALLADTITNNANVKLFNGSEREMKNFTNSSGELAGKRLLAWDIGAYFDAVQGFLVAALEIGIFYGALLLWQKNLLTVGDFALIQIYIFTTVNEIWNFGRVIRQLYESLSDAEEMTIILTMPLEIVDIPGAKELKVTRGEIKYENVVFNYHETRTVVDKLNLVIKPGEKVAVIGPSGAGKTTVVKLLLRMYDLSAGHIYIDGQDIVEVTQESLWQNISLVPQDPILFHRTLIENIRYGRPEATDEEVMAAAKKAHCHEFIIQLENGYDTYVGERGIKLSGGERQRVAIARAILRNAPILVLDEATSSLDSESEHLIQEALAELMKGKTVVVIAHRLSTIKNVDRIIVVKDGRIAEEGNHDELTAKRDGLYKRLWQFQAGGFKA